MTTGVERPTRSRRRMGLVKWRVSHPRSRAIRASARSALTATGRPTASSMGRSVAESEYALLAARSIPVRSASSRMAVALDSP